MAVLLTKNVSLGSPIMAGDEYAYFALSREFPGLDAILAYDPTIQRTNNVLYFWVAHQLWQNFGDPSLVMRVLQSLIYIAIPALVFRICRPFMAPWKSGAISLVASGSAMSSYTAYFMPETLYQALFFLLAAVAAGVSPRRPVLRAALSGLVVAMLLLTKPHAVALVLATGAALAACVAMPRLFGLTCRQALASIVVFALAAYGAMVAINAGLTGHAQFSPLLFVGTFYSGLMALSPGLFPPGVVWHPAVAGHGIAVAMLAGFPLLAILLGLWAVARGLRSGGSYGMPEMDAGKELSARFAFLAVFSILALITSVAMTVRFTTQIAGTEVFRIHGRYYSFTIALCIATMGIAATFMHADPRVRLTIGRVVRLGGMLGILVLLGVQFWWRRIFSITPYDFPEIWSFALNDFSGSGPTIGTCLVVVGGVGFAAMVWLPQRGTLLFLLFFASVDVAGLLQVSKWQSAHSRAFGPYGQPAAALRILLGPTGTLDRGVIIGPDRGALTYTLFNMRSRARVLLLAPNSEVSAATIGEGADWVLLQGAYKLQIPGTVMLKSEHLTFIVLRPMAPFRP